MYTYSMDMRSDNSKVPLQDFNIQIYLLIYIHKYVKYFLYRMRFMYISIVLN